MHVVGMTPYEDFDLLRRNREAVLALCRRFGFDDVRVVVADDASSPPILLIHSRQGTGLLALEALAESLTSVLQVEPRIVLRGSRSAQDLSAMAVLL